MRARKFFALCLLVTAPVLPAQAQTAGDEWDAMMQEAKGLLLMRQYDLASQTLQEALELARMERGRGHPSVAVTLSNLGDVELERDSPDTAYHYYKQALAIFKATSEGPFATLGVTLNNMGLIADQRGQSELARHYYGKALPVFEATLPADDVNIGRTINNMGLSYIRSGEYAEAETNLKRALPILEAALGADSPEVLSCHHNLDTLRKVLADNPVSP